MKLATITTKENGKPATVTANRYIETLYYLTNRITPNYKVKAEIDEKAGIIQLTLSGYFFGKWKNIANEMIYINVIK